MKVARKRPVGAAVYSSAPASTRRFSGTVSDTIAAPQTHSPPMPSDATSRKSASDQMFGASAQAAVPTEYIPIVSSSVRVRPRRSAMRPKTIPPAAHPISSSDVRMPVHRSVAAAAAGVPYGIPRSTGTHVGATKLKRRLSKMSKPQPSHAANRTIHCERSMSSTVRRGGAAATTSKAAPRYHQYLRKSFIPLNPW